MDTCGRLKFNSKWLPVKMAVAGGAETFAFNLKPSKSEMLKQH